MKNLYILILALSTCFLASAQQTAGELDMEVEKAAVINVVEQFLTAIGDHDIEKVQTLFCEKANISGASLRDGK